MIRISVFELPESQFQVHESIVYVHEFRLNKSYFWVIHMGYLFSYCCLLSTIFVEYMTQMYHHRYTACIYSKLLIRNIYFKHW
jgi:hypothetical protein